MGALHTTAGLLYEARIAPEAVLLDHEHLYLDLKSGKTDDRCLDACTQNGIVDLLSRELLIARDAGVCVVIDCTPPGCGRHAPICRAASRASGVAVVCATGGFQSDFPASWAEGSSLAGIADHMIAELSSGSRGECSAGVPIGMVKVAVSDSGGIRPSEETLLRAAGIASRETGVPVACHVLSPAEALQALSVFTRAGADAGRFIWYHAHVCRSAAASADMIRRGAWASYDGFRDEGAISGALAPLRDLAEAGLLGSILTGQDACAFEWGSEVGPASQVLAFLAGRLARSLLSEGFSAGDVRLLTRDNAIRAFSW